MFNFTKEEERIFHDQPRPAGDWIILQFYPIKNQRDQAEQTRNIVIVGNGWI